MSSLMNPAARQELTELSRRLWNRLEISRNTPLVDLNESYY